MNGCWTQDSGDRQRIRQRSGFEKIDGMNLTRCWSEIQSLRAGWLLWNLSEPRSGHTKTLTGLPWPTFAPSPKRFATIPRCYESRSRIFSAGGNKGELDKL